MPSPLALWVFRRHIAGTFQEHGKCHTCTHLPRPKCNPWSEAVMSEILCQESVLVWSWKGHPGQVSQSPAWPRWQFLLHHCPHEGICTLPASVGWLVFLGDGAAVGAQGQPSLVTGQTFSGSRG